MTEQAAFYALSQLLHGMPESQVNIEALTSNGLNTVAQAVLKANPADRLDAFTAAIAHRDDRDLITRKILSINPNQPPIDPKKIIETLDDDILIMPDLPKKARLTQTQITHAQNTTPWLNDYINYATKRAPMLPSPFHETAGLWLLSVAIARRLYLPMPHDNIYPNLFILWIAPTTIYSKSTGLKIAREIADQAIPHLLLSNEFSPQGLHDDLAGKPPTNLEDLPERERQTYLHAKLYASKRGLLLDEASSIFTALKRDYNTGLAEALMRYYDCQSHTGRTIGRGAVAVRDSYLSFIGGTTCMSLRTADIQSLWLSGLWPRFGLLVPQDKPTYRRYIDPPQQPQHLTEHLTQLTTQHLPTPTNDDDYPQPRGINLGQGVFNAWQAYDEAIYSNILLSETPPPEQLFGIYGRLPTQALKIASCLATADWDGQTNAPTIQINHWWRAQIITEHWRAGAHKLYHTLTGITQNDTDERRILSLIADSGENGKTLRQIYRAERKKPHEIEPVVERLVRDGLIDEFTPDKSRTKFYRIAVYGQPVTHDSSPELSQLS